MAVFAGRSSPRTPFDLLSVNLTLIKHLKVYGTCRPARAGKTPFCVTTLAGSVLFQLYPNCQPEVGTDGQRPAGQPRGRIPAPPLSSIGPGSSRGLFLFWLLGTFRPVIR